MRFSMKHPLPSICIATEPCPSSLRLLLIFLGALFNQPYLTLFVLAMVMNLETIRRVIVCRDHG